MGQHHPRTRAASNKDTDHHRQHTEADPNHQAGIVIDVAKTTHETDAQPTKENAIIAISWGILVKCAGVKDHSFREARATTVTTDTIPQTGAGQPMMTLSLALTPPH